MHMKPSASPIWYRARRADCRVELSVSGGPLNSGPETCPWVNIPWSKTSSIPDMKHEQSLEHSRKWREELCWNFGESRQLNVCIVFKQVNHWHLSSQKQQVVPLLKIWQKFNCQISFSSWDLTILNKYAHHLRRISTKCVQNKRRLSCGASALYRHGHLDPNWKFGLSPWAPPTSKLSWLRHCQRVVIKITN